MSTNNNSDKNKKLDKENKKGIKARLVEIRTSKDFPAILIFGSLVLLFLLAIFIFTLSSKDPQVNTNTQNQPTNIDKTKITDSIPSRKGMKRRAIDGVYIDEKSEEKIPLALMIDNFNDARPQSGLSKANLVFEAEAEGGATRYLAIFSNQEKVEEIGPVRSARPYYINWASEVYPLYAHVGGSPAGLAMLAKEDRIYNIDQFYNGNKFWRDNTRFAPHNVYTSTELLNKYIEQKDLSKQTFNIWRYKEDAFEQDRGEDKQSILINYMIKSYRPEWIYNKKENNYTRKLGGKLHKEKNGNLIKAKNIIIQYVDSEVLDGKLRQKFHSIGEGKSIICQDGKCQNAIWKKPSETSRTKFYNSDNNEIKFNAGLTWVSVIGPDYKVTINNKKAEETLAPKQK